jgi:hypothetical protein
MCSSASRYDIEYSSSLQGILKGSVHVRMRVDVVVEYSQAEVGRRSKASVVVDNNPQTVSSRQCKVYI